MLARLEDHVPRPQALPTAVLAPAWGMRWSWTWMAPAAAVLAVGFMWTIIRPSLLAPGPSPATPTPAATFADRELAGSPAEARVEADARKDVTGEVRKEVPVLQTQAASQVSERTAPRGRAAGGEALKAEATMAKTVAAEQANAARVEPGMVGGVARAQEPAKLAERVAPADRLQARTQAAEAQAAAMQVVPAGAPAAIVIITSPDPAAMWRLGPGGLIHRSTDSGQSWQRQDTGVREALAAGSSPAPAICWVVGRQGTVIRTVDGTTWEVTTPPAPVDLIRVTARDALSATVTTADGRRFETTDGGRTWRER